MDEVSLSSSEKAQVENQKQLYVLLRMIHFLEKYYSYDRIDADTYKTEISKLVEKYNRFSQVIPNYSLDSMLRKFNIPAEEISWAKLVLEKGIHTQEQKGKETFLYMQAVAKFIETIETLDYRSDNPVVAELKTPLQELHIILKKLNTKLGTEFAAKFAEYGFLLKSYVQSKSINESLTDSEFREIKLNVEGMYRMMEIIMKS